MKTLLISTGLIAVLFLSASSNVDAQGKETTKPATKTVIAEKEVPKPIIAPQLPDLKWTEKAKTKLERALNGYSDDQVSAYLTFSEVLESEDKDEKITSNEQRNWLESTRTIIRSRALGVVERDYKSAIASDDLRSALISAVVITKIRGQKSEENILDYLKGFQELSNLMERSLRGQSRFVPIWKIADVNTKRSEHYGES